MRNLFFITLILFGIKSFSQDSTLPYKIICGHQEIFPEYPGGEKALMKYLKDSIYLPDSLLDNGWSGKIIVRFKVDSLGFVNNVKIIKDDICDIDVQAKIINVFVNMPRWKPGTEIGKPKEFNYTLPVNFARKN